MDVNFEKWSTDLLDKIKDLAKTENVVGQPFQVGEFSCVPIIKISLGIGSGGSQGDNPKMGKGHAGGVGGGTMVEPVAFIVTKGDEISMLNIGESKGFQSFIDKMPDMVGKVGDIINKKKESKDKE